MNLVSLTTCRYITHIYHVFVKILSAHKRHNTVWRFTFPAVRPLHPTKNKTAIHISAFVNINTHSAISSLVRDFQ